MAGNAAPAKPPNNSFSAALRGSPLFSA